MGPRPEERTTPPNGIDEDVLESPDMLNTRDNNTANVNVNDLAGVIEPEDPETTDSTEDWARAEGYTPLSDLNTNHRHHRHGRFGFGIGAGNSYMMVSMGPGDESDESDNDSNNNQDDHNHNDHNHNDSNRMVVAGSGAFFCQSRRLWGIGSRN